MVTRSTEDNETFEIDVQDARTACRAQSPNHHYGNFPIDQFSTVDWGVCGHQNGHQTSKSGLRVVMVDMLDSPAKLGIFGAQSSEKMAESHHRHHIYSSL